MSKLLFFSDIHIAAHKGRQDRLEDCLEVLQWVFTTARERNIKKVVFGGDLFQDRQKIQVLAYNKTFNILAANQDIDLYLLLGNHDLWYYDNTDISSVYPFSALPNITVIAEPSTVKIGDISVDFLPFTHNPINALKEWRKCSPVLVGHIAVDGAVLNFHHRTKAEVSVEHENDMTTVSRDLFDGWDKVFLGHYHGAQKLTEKVEYMGSPLQLSFGEAFQQKHILILDTDTMKVEPVINNFSPRHLIIDASDMPSSLGRNFVRVYVEDLHSADVIDLKNSLKSKSPNAHVTYHEKEVELDKESQEEKMKKFNLATGDLLERFVSSSNTGLELGMLLKIAKEEICLE